MRLHHLWLTALLFNAGTARAGEALKLEEAVRQAWTNSGQISGQRELMEVARGDRWRRFLPHEPTLQYSKTDDGTAETFGLSLVTSFPGRSLAMVGLDGAKARAQEAELRARRFDLSKLLVAAYTDCAAAQATLRLQETTSADLETIFRSLKALYESGRATQAEKIGAELQSRQASLDLRNATDKANTTCQKLKRLLPNAGDEFKTELPEDLDTKFVAELGPQTSDQARAEAAQAVAERSVSTAYWSQLPDFTLNYSRNHYLYLPGSPSGKPWADSIGVSVTLPIFFAFDEAQEAKRARGQARVDKETAQLQKISADTDLADAANEYRRSRARLQELKTKDLALGEALMESTYSAYRIGKLGFSELVLARKTLTDLRAQEIQLRVAIIGAHLRCLDQCGTVKGG